MVTRTKPLMANGIQVSKTLRGTATSTSETQNLTVCCFQVEMKYIKEHSRTNWVANEGKRKPFIPLEKHSAYQQNVKMYR